MKHDGNQPEYLVSKISAAELLTKSDLHAFKEDLLRSIFAMLQTGAYKGPKKWLKTEEVKKLLNISPGTLHKLRHNGTIPYTKIGNLCFYDIEEIHRLLNSSTTKQPWEQK
jgi:excisionase family DNA binding protein